MASRSKSSMAPLASFVSLVLLLILAAGLYLVWQGGRQEPLRTVELQVPLPDIEPPGMLPDSEVAPLNR